MFGKLKGYYSLNKKAVDITLKKFKGYYSLNKKKVLLVSVMVLMFLCYAGLYYNSAVEYHIRVQSLVVGMSNEFLVIGKNEIFTNKNDLLYAKTNSLYLQSRIRRGKVYTVIVAGWSFPQYGIYRNIVWMGHALN